MTSEAGVSSPSPKVLVAKLLEARDKIWNAKLEKGERAVMFDTVTIGDATADIFEVANALEASDSTTTDTLERVESGVINGLRQIRKELAADLGNIKAPVVSRTKKQILGLTIAEIEVLLSNWEALIHEARTKAEG